MDLLTTVQEHAPKYCPYVFMDPGRWDIYRASVELGHSDINTTQQYYLSVQNEDLKKAQQLQD